MLQYYSPVPRLEHLALVRISVTIWTSARRRQSLSDVFTKNPIQTDIFNRLVYTLPIPVAWSSVENDVLVSTAQLCLPILLQAKLAEIITDTGFQILDWIYYHGNIVDPKVSALFIDKLIWTYHGTVDRRESAKTLIQDTRLTLIQRYALACVCCLETEIPIIWHEICVQGAYRAEAGCDITELPHIVFFWKRKLSTSFDFFSTEKFRLETIGALGKAVKAGNYVAVQYLAERIGAKYLPLLTMHTIYNIKVYYPFTWSNVISGSYKPMNKNIRNVLRALLSNVDKVNMQHILLTGNFTVLRTFLYWRHYSFFLEIASHCWEYLTRYEFLALLVCFVLPAGRSLRHYKREDNLTCFRSFWTQAPERLRKFVMREKPLHFITRIGYVLNYLLQKNAYLEVILSGASAKDVDVILFTRHDGEISICEFLLQTRQWETLKNYIRKFVHSEDDLMRLQKYGRTTFSRYRRKFNSLMEQLIFEWKQEVRGKEFVEPNGPGGVRR